jgi:hypothetical protein
MLIDLAICVAAFAAILSCCYAFNVLDYDEWE